MVMKEVPQQIVEAFDRLKKEYGTYIELKLLHRMYCIFEATSKYDPYIGRSRKVTRYLGYITREGVIVPARHRKLDEGTMAELIELRREVRELRRLAPEEEEQKITVTVEKAQEIDEQDKTILTALSMNSRIPYETLSKIVGLKVKSLPYRIKRLGEIFGIKYTLELNLKRLGFFRFFIFVKFLDKVSDLEEKIGKNLEANPRVQLAMLTKGAYDLVIYCVAEDDDNLISTINLIRADKNICNLTANWYVTPIRESYGFIPLRDTLFDILKEKVWHRTKDNPRPSKSDLLYREYVVLKELNRDSTISFSEIDRKYQLTIGSAKAAYEKLIEEERKVIWRPTLTLQNINIKYNGIIMINLVNVKSFMKMRNKYRLDIVEEHTKVVNKFAYGCDIEMPDGSLRILPVFKEGELGEIENWFTKNMPGFMVETLTVMQVIVGDVAYRRFDNLYSPQYQTLLKEKVIEPKNRINYGIG